MAADALLKAAQIVAALPLVLLNGSQAMADPYQVPAEQLLRMGVLGRALVRVGDSNGVVSLKVIVSAEGAVESVTHLDGPRYALEKAAAAEKRLRFGPFMREGKAVRATFRDAVSIYPEERWGNRQTFPAIRDWKTVSLTMERRIWCDQPRCVSYTIRISGEGAVLFTRTKWASSDPNSFTARLTRTMSLA